MALVLRWLHDRYHYYFHEFQDSRLNDYPLVHSPIQMLTIIGVYMYFVVEWGPKFMENRKPYELKQVIRFYNLSQVFFNFFIATYMLYYSYLQSEFSFICQPIDPTNTKPFMKHVVFATFLAYMGKYYDLLDTVFFVLRKKKKQITFLHLYHHSLVVVLFYSVAKFGSGSHLTLTGLLNNYVHVFMYGYYFISSFEEYSTKYQWLKKFITQLQLLQFGIIFIHLLIAHCNADCKFPVFVSSTMLVQTVFMIVLFSDFYIRAYVLKKNKIT